MNDWDILLHNLDYASDKAERRDAIKQLFEAIISKLKKDQATDEAFLADMRRNSL